MDAKIGKNLNILSFNWHEPYLCMLAATGHQFFIIEPLMANGTPRKWDERMRPVPQNVTVVPVTELSKLLEAGAIDLIICQNAKDIFAVSGCQNSPKILVFHNKLTTEIALGGNSVDRENYLSELRPRLSGVKKVFISRSKQADWGMDGVVIPPGINVADYGGYSGERAEILRVGNRIMERDLMMGYSEQESVCNGFDSVIVGDNPAIGSSLSGSWEELKEHYRTNRFFLNTTKEPYEDGYNLAMLEAMASGMPVISLANETSPLTDGVEGFVHANCESLKNRARWLLDDRELAMKMGSSARETVIKKFPMEKFIKSWNKVIGEAVDGGGKVSGAHVSDAPAKVWMDYAYYPATTAHYIRRAFEKNHSVVTSGGSITPDILKMWNLENMKAGILPQDIPRNGLPDARSIYKNMPKGFSPEFFLWVETGLESPPAGLERLPLPKAAYLIDTHINLEMHLRLARQFDVIFLAQREYVEQFRKSGIKNVHWLPLGCDPQIHGALEVPKLYDVGFAGSITKSGAHNRRKNLLEKLKSTVNLEVRRVFLEEMAHLFSSSRIVFNNAIKNDLNMRVFEALCSGSLLLTDDAEGISDLFTDKKDLVIYKDETIAELALYYLENDDEREEIAKAGREKVLAHHTYAHRADKMVETMRGLAEPITVQSVKPDYYYRGERPEIMEMVPQGAMRILEVGCGAGVTSRMLKEENGERELVGVESDAAAAKEAAKLLDTVFYGDVEKMRLPYPDGYFDCIIYADVLEHLREPDKLLEKHKRLLSNDGIMVMSIPNTKHFSVVNQLMEGRWEYVESGLLDSTHIRFFTLTEIKEMLKGCGLSPLEIRAKRGDKVYREGSRGTLKIGRWQIDNLSEDEMLDFFVFQYLLTVRKEPQQAAEKEPFDPERFKEMIAENAAVLKTFGEKFVEVGGCITRNENKKAAELLASLKAVKEPARLCWIGHFNMALGDFRQAEAVYRELDDEKFTGCALAARGLLFDGLSSWWKARRDEEVAGWLDSYGNGRSGREEIFLTAAEEGNGVRFSTYDQTADFPPDNKLDYISSYHRLENEADVVQTLIDWRDALKDGGVAALLCAHSSSDETQIYPLPKHRFTPQSLEKIVRLIGGLQTIAVKDCYEEKSFVLILQKGDKTNNGNRFDYERRLQKLLSRHALEKSAVYRGKEQPEAAAQCVETALFLDPENSTALTMFGDGMMKKGDAQTAARFYQKAISLSDSAAPLIGMGTLRLTESDFESASDCFAKAVSKETENDRAICGLGISTFNLGKREEGFELYQKAFEINPENMVALSSIVKAGYALKKPEPAESALMKFLELHPANVDILFSLAGIRFFAGKMEEAGEVLEKVFLFAPDHEDAKRLYEKIETGQKGSRV